MAIIGFEELKWASELYMAEWSVITVRDEMMTPMGPEGKTFISFWDNWLLPPNPNGIEIILILNGYALDSDQFKIVRAGDSVRGKIELAKAAGPDAVVMATYRRSMFRDSFWETNLLQAIIEIKRRLLSSSATNNITEVDDSKDPWWIIVKQAGRNALANLQTMLSGLGSALPLDAKLLTPTGWIAMREIKLGDKLCSSSGGYTTVTGVYPQGECDIYKVTFSDGSSTECTLDHMWATRRQNWRRERGYCIHSLKEIMDTLHTSTGGSNHSIPMCSPIEFQIGDELPVDPYLLGLLLGDGSIDNGVTLHNPEVSIHEAAAACLTNDMEMKVRFYSGKSCPKLLFSKKDQSNWNHKKNSLLLHLIDLGLQHHTCYTKFIPDVYKFASVPDRVALLQGLMDTDGYCSKDGMTIEYCTVSPQLALDFQFVVQSLGGTCEIAKKDYFPYNADGTANNRVPSYRMYPTLPSYIVPFRASLHKLSRFKPKTKYLVHRMIRSVELIGCKEAQCIKVQAEDGLFMTNDCILTHNTQMEGIKMDLSRAHNMVHEVAADLLEDIDRDIVAERWRNAPAPRRAFNAMSITLAGPGPTFGLY